MTSLLHYKSNEPNQLNGKSGVVFKEMEAQFASGHYKFGELLSTAEIASRFGVSIQPVRSAINRLEALGYVNVVAQVGCRVVSPTLSEIADFFYLFGRMEGVMASLAASRHAPSEVSSLDLIADKIESCIAPENGLPPGYAEGVNKWHAAVRALAHSPVLSSRVSPLWPMADFFVHQGASWLSLESIAIANKQRRNITAAIKDRDGNLAEKLMFEYVRTKPMRADMFREI